MARTAEQILETLDLALRGGADIDPFEPIGELVEDILEHVAAALKAAGTPADIIETATSAGWDHYTASYRNGSSPRRVWYLETHDGRTIAGPYDSWEAAHTDRRGADLLIAETELQDEQEDSEDESGE